MNYYDEHDLNIFKKVNKYIENGLVNTYDSKLISFLSTHTDSSNENIKTNYLDALNSTYSIGICYQFARYVALGLDISFNLYEGNLSNLHNGNFPQAWIETEDSVYDVTFTGKWPKKLYYQLFNPIIEKDIDLKTDEKYNHYKKHTIKTNENKIFYSLNYIDWYDYISKAQTYNASVIYLRPEWYYFPEDIAKNEHLQLFEFIEEKWNKQTNVSHDEIPPELFSEELIQYIDDSNMIKDTYFLYKELIRFIATNKDIYEEKKQEPYDISLWKKAIDGKYSGSFCKLISNVPNIINEINQRETITKKKK